MNWILILAAIVSILLILVILFHFDKSNTYNFLKHLRSLNSRQKAFFPHLAENYIFNYEN